MDNLTDAQVLLLAAQLTATPDLPQLHRLAAGRQDVLDHALLLRMLLTYLPVDIEPDIEEQLLALLESLDDGFNNFSPLDTSLPSQLIDDDILQDPEALLTRLTLEYLPVYDPEAEADLLSDFLIAWIQRLDEYNGLPVFALTLADQFAHRHPVLRHWADAFLRPLHRLQNEYYIDRPVSLSLHDLETIHGESGVAALLQFAAQAKDHGSIARDLDDIVAPWIRGAKSTKRRKLSQEATGWQDVNKWLLSLSQQDFVMSSTAMQRWNGPSQDQDADPAESSGADYEAAVLAYVRTIFASIFTSHKSDDPAMIIRKQSLLNRAANLAQLMPPDDHVDLPDVPDLTHLEQASRSDLIQTTFLSSTNLLTRPSTDTIDFLHGVLCTQNALSTFRIDSTTRSVASTVLFDSEEKQQAELRTILNQIPRLTRSSLAWKDVRQKLLWLHKWSTSSDHPHSTSRPAYLGRLSTEYLEEQLLDAMLAAAEYQTIQDMYLAGDDILPKAKVQQHVTTAVLNAYDNASNGNKTRGGVKKALDLLNAFKSALGNPDEFRHLEALIQATHSLSFYQLTLQHGVPFKPVSIRASSDPLSLLEKVLDQDNKAYTKLDDLLSIARNLVLADLPVPSPSDLAPGDTVPISRRLFDAEHRITYSAINAALADHDFDTAYSLITTRLHNPNTRTLDAVSYTDDTSWRAALAAGKHRPNATNTTIHNQISSLQKRMELLSTALTLAPTPDPLPEILTAWRRLEEDLDALKSQALEEERAFDAASTSTIPGGFGPTDRDLDANETQRLQDSRRSYNTTTSPNTTTATAPSYEEEAPMGLFDVARGAAAALGRGAFPLRAAAAGPQSPKTRHSQHRTSMHSRTSTDDYNNATMSSSRTSSDLQRPGSADGQRLRKRDMLSSAVTGGLVSGMSWVLGAPAPASGPPAEERGE